MAKRNPKRFDDCVTKVTRSLKKRGRKGNAYAICTAAGTRTRKNQGLDELLDSVTSLSPTAAALKAIEKQREKLARKLDRESKRNGAKRRKNPTIWQKPTVWKKQAPKPKKKARLRLLPNGRRRNIAHVARNIARNIARGNPEEDALAVYEGLHGRPSEELIRVTTPIHEHKYVAGLGELRKLVVISLDGRKVTINNFGVNAAGQPAILSTNEKRSQLFIDGGDQSVDPREFGVDEPFHETETLGRVRNVYYFTTKDHLGDEGGTATYNHKFGGIRKVNGRRKRSPLPDLIYDVRNKLLHFSGGGYSVPDEGIAN
jgi:hypothetical protein